MGSDKKVEMTEKATRKLMEDEETDNDNTCSSYESPAAAHDDGEESGKPGINRRRNKQLPAELLSELDSLADDDDDDDDDDSETRDEKRKSSKEVGEEIIKELKNIKRQNTITHYLLTASILVTLAWQLSEISLILKIRQGLNNPLKSIGGVIKVLFGSSSQENSDQDSSSQKQIQVITPTYLPGLKIPDLPHLELPGFETTNDDDDD